jgi:hypothetical protein
MHDEWKEAGGRKQLNGEDWDSLSLSLPKACEHSRIEESEEGLSWALCILIGKEMVCVSREVRLRVWGGIRANINPLLSTQPPPSIYLSTT